MAALYSAAWEIRPAEGHALTARAVPASSDSRDLPLGHRTISVSTFAARSLKAPELAELAIQIPRHIAALGRDDRQSAVSEQYPPHAGDARSSDRFVDRVANRQHA